MATIRTKRLRRKVKMALTGKLPTSEHSPAGRAYLKRKKQAVRAAAKRPKTNPVSIPATFKKLKLRRKRMEDRLREIGVE